MKLLAGMLLKSSAALEGTYFSGVSIYLVACDNDGAIGLVINRPFGRTLRDLEEFKDGPPVPLFEGGPVDQEHLFFLHRRPDIIPEGISTGKGIFWGGNFRQAFDGLSRQQLSPNDVKLFIGYCGWDAGELEAEIEEGSWRLATEKEVTVF